MNRTSRTTRIALRFLAAAAVACVPAWLGLSGLRAHAPTPDDMPHPIPVTTSNAAPVWVPPGCQLTVVVHGEPVPDVPLQLARVGGEAGSRRGAPSPITPARTASSRCRRGSIQVQPRLHPSTAR